MIKGFWLFGKNMRYVIFEKVQHMPHHRLTKSFAPDQSPFLHGCSRRPHSGRKLQLFSFLRSTVWTGHSIRSVRGAFVESFVQSAPISGLHFLMAVAPRSVPFESEPVRETSWTAVESKGCVGQARITARVASGFWGYPSALLAEWAVRFIKGKLTLERSPERRIGAYWVR